MAVVNLLDLMTSRPRPNPVALAIKRIENAGHDVQLTGDIPGLFRVDGGPEITTNQLMQIASTVRPVTEETK